MILIFTDLGRHYLLGRPFRIFTDQQSLRSSLTQTVQTQAQHKWLTKLFEFYYEILYTPGRSNHVADALSCFAPTFEVVYFAVSICQPLVLPQLQQFYIDHVTGHSLLHKFQPSSDPRFIVAHGILYFKDKFFIPLETDMRLLLLQEFHASPSGGHYGVRNPSSISNNFFVATHGT